MKYIPKTLNMARIKQQIGSIPIKIRYALLAFAMIPSYFVGREIMIDQSTSYLAVISKFTVNFFLFLYLVGFWIDYLVKEKGYSQRKGWVIWAAVMVIIVVFFKYVGGMDTRF